REPRERERSEQCSDCAWKSRRDFAHSEQLEAQRGRPIVKRRLLKPGFAVKTRRNPITSFRHVARDPRITRLIWSDKSERAQMAEVADSERGENQDCVRDASCGR